ncbi:MAG: hypothetical protein JEZ12_02575 [Desulfobacterium sp.]|nr:hypothetical protein [Desulfobacterium sp.]
MSTPLLKIAGLAEILDVSTESLYRNKVWAQFPHIFVLGGEGAKQARYIMTDVLAYLKNQHYTEEQKNAIQAGGYMDRGVPDRIKTEHRTPREKKGLPDKEIGKNVGGRGKGRIPGEQEQSKEPACILDFQRKFGVR